MLGCRLPHGCTGKLKLSDKPATTGLYDFTDRTGLGWANPQTGSRQVVAGENGRVTAKGLLGPRKRLTSTHTSANALKATDLHP